MARIGVFQKLHCIRGVCGVLVLVAVIHFTSLIKYDSSKLLTLKYSNMTFTTLHYSEIKQNISYRVVKHIKISDTEKKNLQLLLKHEIIEPASEQVTSDTKVILWYSPTRFHPVLSRLHPLRGCPDAPCRVTTNRQFYNQSDALIFTAQLLNLQPPIKLPKQVWILHNHESPRDAWANKDIPLYTSSWRSKFNWTLDYRSDADVYDPYGVFKMRDGVFQKRQMFRTRNYEAILSSKNGTVAWMVSNCRTMSKRTEYADELSKYVNVDIFGRCGSKKCERSEDSTCLEHISKYYKFYLAFENAFCEDYITEKFFRYYNSDVILIARGGGNYSRVAPIGTFIKSANFKSIKQLADYIRMLNEDDEKYLSILRKKDQYQPLFEEWPIVRNGKIQYMTYHYDAEPMCEVCNRLWNTNKYEKHYKDIGKWFDRGMCYAPDDL